MKVELPETIEESQSLIKHLCVVIEKMQAEIDELKARLKQNSQNSSRPPSSDGFHKPKVALPQKKKKRGGQQGHAGKTLQRVAAPDVVVDCEPESCACGLPQWTSEGEIIEQRQVFELPEPRLEVTEYRRIRRICHCGRSRSGKFPAKVLAPVQYGERVQALVSLLSVQGCLSYGKIGQLFADLYGSELNEATSQAMLKRTSEVMPMEVIKAGIVAAKVVHVDETGLKENGKLRWLHNASTAHLTYQFVHQKRGKAAMVDDPSVLREFTGIAVHDCWESYFSFGAMKHALCHAHLLRELTGIIENSASKWGQEMKDLLLTMYVKSAYGKGVIQEISGFEKSYEKILAAGEKEEPLPERTNPKGKLKRTKGRNLLERLTKHQAAVLRFAKEEDVPFTNNQAERDIRPSKVKQKMSGGFRAASGTESYCRIQSFISTLRKLNRQVFQELLSVIAGNPFEILQT